MFRRSSVRCSGRWTSSMALKRCGGSWRLAAGCADRCAQTSARRNSANGTCASSSTPDHRSFTKAVPYRTEHRGTRPSWAQQREATAGRGRPNRCERTSVPRGGGLRRPQGVESHRCRRALLRPGTGCAPLALPGIVWIGADRYAGIELEVFRRVWQGVSRGR